MEQPHVVEKSLGLTFKIEKNFKRIIMVACGTASYASYVGKYIIEKIAKIQVLYEIASEFRYKEPLISKDDLVIVDDDDVLLVCEKGKAQELKKIIEKLKQEKKEKYL